MEIKNAENSRIVVIELLRQENLPYSDLPESLENFLVAGEPGNEVGVAGIEIYGKYALLRSMAVSKPFRGIGIASNLLKSIELIAVTKRLKCIYLLTESASEYFGKKGYKQIARMDVPAEVRTSSEFSHVCPQSAIVMKKEIKR